MFWWWISRFGQAEVVLPCLAAAAVWLAATRERHAAAVWLGWFSVAVLATLATKVAFIGWGMGIDSLDFTGVSGHTLLAGAVWPVLLARLAPPRPGWRIGGALLGYTLALLVAVSRLALAAHSLSEVVAGFILGGMVSAAALVDGLPASRLRAGWLPLALALWLAVAPIELPSSRAHGLVVQLALHLSRHAQPHVRAHSLGGIS